MCAPHFRNFVSLLQRVYSPSNSKMYRQTDKPTNIHTETLIGIIRTPSWNEDKMVCNCVLKRPLLF